MVFIGESFRQDWDVETGYQLRRQIVTTPQTDLLIIKGVSKNMFRRRSIGVPLNLGKTTVVMIFAEVHAVYSSLDRYLHRFRCLAHIKTLG
jgi:hypothetical protein